MNMLRSTDAYQGTTDAYLFHSMLFFVPAALLSSLSEFASSWHEFFYLMRLKSVLVRG